MSTAGPLALPSPAGVAAEGAVARVVRTPTLFCLATLTITVTGLALDHFANLSVQMLLALCTWGFLAIAFVYLTPMERAQTSVVVLVATCAEIIGSVIWGVYTYRLGNLPLFVPPGHGLVYLTGLSLTQTSLVSRHQRAFLVTVAALALGWAVAGLTVLPRVDASGALGMSVFLLFLWRGRARVLYGAVFLVVAVLEISGTAVGVWAWKDVVPGLQLPSGNPPSGAASGYVLFDIVAIAVTARLFSLWQARQRGGQAPLVHPPLEP